MPLFASEATSEEMAPMFSHIIALTPMVTSTITGVLTPMKTPILVLLEPGELRVIQAAIVGERQAIVPPAIQEDIHWLRLILTCLAEVLRWQCLILTYLQEVLLFMEALHFQEVFRFGASDKHDSTTLILKGLAEIAGPFLWIYSGCQSRKNKAGSFSVFFGTSPHDRFTLL